MIIKYYDNISLDSRNTLSLSKKERLLFGDEIIIMKDQKQLFLLGSEEELKQLIIKRVTGLTGSARRRIIRFLCSNTFTEKISKNRRVFIPYQIKERRKG